MNESELFEAIKKKEWQIFINNVTSEHDLNIRDEGMNYMIQYVINANEKEVLIKILEFNVLLDWKDIDNKTILYIPIKYNYEEIIDILLQYDKNNIGSILTNLKDGQGNFPIHYALLFKNIKLYTKLIKLSNILTLNLQKDSLLHLSVKTKDINYVKVTIEHNINVNLLNNYCETALHIACSYGLTDIIDFLLQHGANLNICEKNHGFTPLMTSIINGKIDDVSLIKLKNPDINITDNQGNTALHIALLEYNELIVKNLCDLSFNYNITNIDGNTCLHIILQKISLGEKISTDVIDHFLKNTKLNIQNNNGNTCLHNIIKLKLFLCSHHADILKEKKNNLFIKNKKNITPYDYCKEFPQDVYNTIMTIVIQSYYYQLKNTKLLWTEDWENVCTTNEKKCLLHIKDMIINEERSVPIKKSKYIVDVNELEDASYTTFTGINFDIITGYINLAKNNVLHTSITTDFIKNNSLLEYYKQLGIIKDLDNECLNFQIYWIFQKIFYPLNIIFSINNFLKSDKNIMTIPLAIDIETGSHANVIIIDKHFKTIERFEPNGKKEPNNFNYNKKLLDTIIKKFLLQHLLNFTYLTPEETQLEIGFQSREICEQRNKKIGDPCGFCVAWCIWYCEQRIKYFNIHPIKLANKLMINIRSKNISFKKLIRNYSVSILDVRNEILNQLSLDINDVRNDNLSEEQNINIKQLIKLEIMNL